MKGGGFVQGLSNVRIQGQFAKQAKDERDQRKKQATLLDQILSGRQPSWVPGDLFGGAGGT